MIEHMQKSRGLAEIVIAGTSRYFKTDMSYLLRGGFWLTLAQVATTIAGFILSIAFARYLPKDIYGNYRYILSLAPLIGAFSLTGLNTAIIQSVARGNEGVLKSSFWLNLRWSIPSALLAFSGSAYYFFRDNQILGISLLVIGVLTPILNSAGLFASFITGKKDFRRLSQYTIIDNLIPVACLFIALYFTRSVLPLIFVYFASHTVIGLVLYSRTLRKYQPQPINDPEIISYSKRLSLLNILAIITAQVDKVLIFTWLGSVELAIYGIATSFPEHIKALLRNTSSLMIPKFAEKRFGSDSLNLKKKVFQFAAIVTAVIIVYILAAPYIFQIFFPTYPESIQYSRIFALSVISMIALVPQSILISQKRENELSRVSIWSSIFQIVILLIFIHYWGLMGVVIARVLSAYVTAALNFIMVGRHYRL